MNTETIEFKEHTIFIEQDTSPTNPFEEFDCEPPLLTYYDGHITKYGNVPDIGDLVALIPEHHFARHNRVALIREYLNVSLREFAEHKHNYYEGTARDGYTFADLLAEQCPEPSRGSYASSVDYFEALESLCELAGVPCYHATSRGYCQGDYALVIAFATPEWVAKVGAPDDSLREQCKGAFDLYTAWAWGDCYGIARIEDPEGYAIEDGSCWGFYGSDHEKSGLLDCARSSINCNIALAERARAAEERRQEKEQAEAFAWACRDVATA